MARQNSFKVCFCFRRIFKLGVAEPPQDIKKLFENYSENGGMTVDHLHRFLIEIQKEDNISKEEAQAIFNSLKHLSIFPRKEHHLDAFFRYLFSDNNPPLSPSLGVHHDMNAPLAHYFLYTGHNSYLTGNQLSSDCSVDPIIKALKRGVRVIELDLWPNDTRDNVKVCHGGTLTTPVELDKCLWAIKENAFVASEYPVVITFEDHLTRNLQAKVAQMVTKTFGSMLFYPKEGYLKEFPSPESLKKRIIISTKPPKEYLHSQSNKDKRNLSKVVNDSEEGQPVGNDKIDVKKELEHDLKQDEPHEGEDNQDEDGENGVPEYRRLIGVHAGKLKGGLDNWLSIDPDKASRLSLSEQELEDAVQTHGKAIVRFTQRNLLRVYPKGLRVNSSNYNPLVGWMHGAQMVAFNMQGYGKHLWMMHGMFRANGGCGYVKKPDFLLNESKVFDPSENFPVKKTLRVKVFMGDGWHLDFHHTHFDRFSPPDFFTKIGIVGVPADTTAPMKKTKAIEDEWIPLWNEEFEFPLTVPELALLRIEVGEFDTTGSHDFGGQTCLPISELRSGIRAVPLHDRRGQKYRSVKLLMQFQFV